MGVDYRLEVSLIRPRGVPIKQDSVNFPQKKFSGGRQVHHWHVFQASHRLAQGSIRCRWRHLYVFMPNAYHRLVRANNVNRLAAW